MYKQVKKEAQTIHCLMFFRLLFQGKKQEKHRSLILKSVFSTAKEKKISTSLFLVLIPKVFPYKRRSLGHNLHQEFLNMPLTAYAWSRRRFFYTSDTQIFSPFVTILKRPQTSFSSKHFLPIFPRLAQLPLNGFHSLTRFSRRVEFSLEFHSFCSCI